MLKCEICSEPAQGQHFGVNSCRPCAAFYRRCILERLHYVCLPGTNRCNIKIRTRKRCKACRFRICQLAGMRYEPKNADEFLQAPTNSFTILVKILEAKQKFLQQSGIFYGNRLNFDENAGEQFYATKYFLIEMLDESIELFAQLSQVDKLILIGECRRQLHFLLNYSNFYGQNYSDLTINERILWRQICHFPMQIEAEDICALIGLTIFHKALDIPSIQNARWNGYREAILAEWFANLCQRTQSTHNASMQMARLLSTMLVQLDLCCHQTKCLEKSKNSQENQYPSPILRANSNQFAELAQHCRIARCHRRIWDSVYEFPDANEGIFTRVEEMVTGNDNIFRWADTFAVAPPTCTDKWTFFAELDAIDQADAFHKHPRIRKWILINRLLSIGLLKTMPIWGQMGRMEQAEFLHHMKEPIMIFARGYYAAQIGADTLVGHDGIASCEVLRAMRRFRQDRHLLSLADNYFNCAVKPFLRIQLLSAEEFALLLAILCNHPGSSQLSPHTIQLLYAEQTRLSSKLFQFLQAQLGVQKGLKRYAECMDLLQSVFHSTNRQEMFRIYLETIHLRQEYYLDLPKKKYIN